MKRSKALIILVAAAVCIAATILFKYNPEAVSLYPRCPSKLLTGYDCPGCGTLSALHALLHGKIATAWGYNPALFFAIPAIIFFGAASHYRQGSIAQRICTSKLTTRIILVAVVAWWICRNL
jgi:hypothetical protein